MTIHNIEIAGKLIKLADLLEIEGANPFRIRAYRNAANTIASLSKSVEELIRNESDITELPAIGKDIAEKIKTLITTGSIPLLSEIEKRLPPVLCDLLMIEGMGPKRVQILYKKLKLQTAADLKAAIEAGKLRKIKGFGEKTEQRILSGIAHEALSPKKMRLSKVLPMATAIVNFLKTVNGVIRVEVAGSFRRRKEMIGDLDILVTASKSGKNIIEAFVNLSEVSEVFAKGSTRSTVRLNSGLQVDLRVVKDKSFGAALVYFTGSKAHNIAIRKMAVKKKLKINEYGVFKNENQIAGKTEADVYAAIGLPYIEPELRENCGEIHAAQQNKLPHLITLDNICGDLHCHTLETDGKATIDAIANKAIELGYQYIAITDHSKRLAITHGLDEKRLLAQIKLIDKLNEKYHGQIVILKSIEMDILEDGTLDLSDDVLKELDFRVCSLHSRFNYPSVKQTERVLRAMDNRYFNIWAHPTGRLISMRDPYEIDLEKIMLAAKDRNIVLELNAQPSRLDLKDEHIRMTKEIGLKIAISTDAHSLKEMHFMSYGIDQARRGWLEKSDVINTFSLNDLKNSLKR